MHLVIYFFSSREGHPNLDNPHFSFGERQDFKYLYRNDNIATLAVEGSWHKDVCDDWIFPNLSDFAKRFVRKLFPHNDENTLTLDSTLIDGNNTVGLIEDFCSLTARNNPTITEITLCGYSRGAVTCFNVARELNKIAPLIPVNIVANQPVPGSLCVAPGTNADSIMDCSDVTNLKKVSIILGTSTTKDLTHRAFYNQIVPKLPRNTEITREIIAIPRTNHEVSPKTNLKFNTPFGERHLHMQVAKYLHESNIVTQELVETKIKRAAASYTDGTHLWSSKTMETPHFPWFGNLQTFFGITSRQLDRYKDPLHPAPHLSEGYEWNSNDSLMDWWNQHDQESSYFISAATNSLIECIRSITDTNEKNVQTLIWLFKRVEEWLIEKEHTQSSRYWLVTALKNNIYHELTTTHGISPDQLKTISQELKHENRYFQKHWHALSTAASFWKTKATEKLDKDFKAHATNEINDEQLLAALNNWLVKKQGSHSKRWDIVLEMKEMLEEVIKTSASSHSLINK